MNKFYALAGGLALAATVSAQPVLVSADITTSTTWTSNNVYNLQQQIYVRNGATLTIEAGTRIESTANLGGSLAVARGSKIEARGTATRPIVFTSTNDNGTARTGANEWGNLTIMGNAYISEDVNGTATPNTSTPNASNFAFMEGLLGTGPDQRYGGGDDNDNSGTVTYCSFRFGGRVIALTNELNGLSLGGIGRNTTINHVEVYNNVDDGIEIWGGTVNINRALISNVGDDSFDVDQGWRGSADQICIIQGYSVNAPQGSGHGDNAFEIDGAEQSDYQPRTRCKITNATVIGAPPKEIAPGTGIFVSGSGSDHATAWRDGAGVQYTNCIFMDVGEKVVAFDNIDGDGGAGYGINGTPAWPAIWSLPATTLPSVNAGTGTGAPSALYTAQDPSGTVCQMTDSVIYNAINTNAYTTYNSLGLNTGNDNVNSATTSPVVSVTHGLEITTARGPITRVTAINPQPQGDALTPVSPSIAGHNFRGAFEPGVSWANWTAMAEYGVLATTALTALTSGSAGANGNPVHGGTFNGTTGAGTADLSNAPGGAAAILLLGLTQGNTSLAPFGLPDITLVPALGGPSLFTFTNGSGSASVALNYGPNGSFPGIRVYTQFLVGDATGNGGATATNGSVLTLQ
ncbi:MAG: hypothetical protein NXI31_16300 [bacterium]|nr:hypothetical protein [bacterium]